MTMPGRLKSSSPASAEASTPTLPDPASVTASPTRDSPASTTPPSSAPGRSPSPNTLPVIQRPPPPSTPERSRQALVRNRRLHFLANNPGYFTSPDLELADPLLYDRLIRQYQTPAEREEQGRLRGWSGVLEADLTRAEAKVAALAESENVPIEMRAETARGEAAATKEEGEELWRETMTLRFLEGRDGDADYEAIDESENWDDWVTRRRDEEEQYFDAETPSVVTSDTGVLDY